jgi:hypothetical protein
MKAYLAFYVRKRCMHDLLTRASVSSLFLDADWFKAGKGPNPELVKLDSDMDAYFQNKPTKEAEAAEAAPAPAPEAAEPAKE